MKSCMQLAALDNVAKLKGFLVVGGNKAAGKDRVIGQNLQLKKTHMTIIVCRARIFV